MTAGNELTRLGRSSNVGNTLLYQTQLVSPPRKAYGKKMLVLLN